MLRQRIHSTVDQGGIRHAQQGQRAVVRHALRPGTGQQLVHNRQRVTRRTATRADDQRIHRILHRHALAGHHRLQQSAHIRRRQQAERVVVGSGADGLQQLLRLRRGEDEDQVLRRLLHDLQQGVETRRGDHVRLVNNEHPVARFRRRIKGAFAQLAHVVHAVVRGGVQLRHIQVPRPAGRQRYTGFALSTGRGRRPFHAVQRASQDARRRRLTAAARPGKQVCVVDPPAIQRHRQRLGHVGLPHDLGKRRRTIFPIKCHEPTLHSA